MRDGGQPGVAGAEPAAGRTSVGHAARHGRGNNRHFAELAPSPLPLLLWLLLLFLLVLLFPWQQLVVSGHAYRFQIAADERGAGLDGVFARRFEGGPQLRQQSAQIFLLCAPA